MATAKKLPHGRILFSASYDAVLKDQATMSNWDSQIHVAMQMIQRTRTGAALIHAINASPRLMLIVPDAGTEINAETAYTDWRQALPAGINISDEAGRPMGRSVGHGSCTIIRITPTNYSRRDGAFSSADGGLFHEMCHGLHVMTGQLSSTRSVGDNFDNLDEFWAITLTNIYMSEKGYPYMRRDHHGREQLAPELSTSQSFYDWAGPQIKEVCRTAPLLSRTVAAVDANFNPIRYYYQSVLHQTV